LTDHLRHLELVLVLVLDFWSWLERSQPVGSRGYGFFDPATALFGIKNRGRGRGRVRGRL